LLLSVRVSVQFVPQSLRSVGQVPYFGVFMVGGISVGSAGVGGGMVTGLVVAGISVSMRT